MSGNLQLVWKHSQVADFIMPFVALVNNVTRGPLVFFFAWTISINKNAKLMQTPRHISLFLAAFFKRYMIVLVFQRRNLRLFIVNSVWKQICL